MWFVLTLFISLIVAVTFIIGFDGLKTIINRRRSLKRYHDYCDDDVKRSLGQFHDHGFTHPSQRAAFEKQAAELHQDQDLNRRKASEGNQS